MSLEHAILGFLARRPMTGYDLKTQCFDKSVHYFWPADQAQIYRTLEKMESKKWVEGRIEVQHDRPNRKLYSITLEGRNELRRWLQLAQPLPIHREPFLVQLYFSEKSTNKTIVDLLEHQRALHEAQLCEYEGIKLSFEGMQDESREVTLGLMTLNLGIRLERAYIEWLEESLDRVRQLPEVENE